MFKLIFKLYLQDSKLKLITFNENSYLNEFQNEKYNNYQEWSKIQLINHIKVYQPNCLRSTLSWSMDVCRVPAAQDHEGRPRLEP